MLSKLISKTSFRILTIIMVVALCLSFSVKPDVADACCFPKSIEGSLQVKKIDYNTCAPLKGVVFFLQYKSGCNWYNYAVNGKLVEKTTDSKGIVKFDKLPKGTYKLVEKSTIEGYDINSYSVRSGISSNKTFTVSICKKNYCATITNKKLPTGKIKVVKYGEKGKCGYEKLAGAEFSLETYINGQWVPYKDKNGDKVYKTTDKNGIVEFNDLIYGKYRLVEEEAAPGYDKNSLKVNYGKGKDHAIVDKCSKCVTLCAYNDKEIKGNLEITKLDYNDKTTPLKDTGFYLLVKKDNTWVEYKDNSGNLITVTSNNEGKAVFNNLPAGEYEVKEQKATPGYDKESLSFEQGNGFFTISKNGETIKLTGYNWPSPVR